MMKSNTEELQKELDHFEQLIEKVRVEYDRYFLGVLRFPPEKAEKEAERIIRKFRTVHIANSMLQFRFNNLVARFITYRERWQRIMMEREGTKKTSYQMFATGLSEEQREDERINQELSQLPAHYDKSKLKRDILGKIKDLKDKGYSNVQVSVTTDDTGKPKLKLRHKK